MEYKTTADDILLSRVVASLYTNNMRQHAELVRPGPLTFHFGTDISSGRWRVVFTVPLLAIHTEIIIILHHARSNVTIRLFPRHQFHTSHDERNNTERKYTVCPLLVLYVLYQKL